jgi:hypothetical protein
MPFPATKEAMMRAEYTYTTSKVCPCGATMELWMTPSGKLIPMNPMPQEESPAVSHWATCEKAAQFRRHQK